MASGLGVAELVPLVTVPIWAVALGFAALAPWCVRAVATSFERRVKARTAEALARSGTASSPPTEQASQASKEEAEQEDG